MPKFIDLTGKTFGHLTVLENLGKLNGAKEYSWRCQCDCGQETIVKGISLRSGNTKSCGCHKYDGIKRYNAMQSESAKIPIGTRFGKLIVVEDLGFAPSYNGAEKNRRWYRCKCDCGNLKDYNGNSLKNGQRTSCGCISSVGEEKIKQILEDNNLSYLYDSPIEKMVKDTGRRLRFDFILLDTDGNPIRCIEFDGNQHRTGMWGGSWSNTEDFSTIHERDCIKDKWCFENKIPLVRIPYAKKETLCLEDILGNSFLVKGDD